MQRNGQAVVGSPIADVIFEDKRVLLLLDDGRQLAAPLSWVGPKVVAMNARERSQWVATADRRGVNWPGAGQTSADGALHVWMLEQDALFEAALAELEALDWKTDQLPHRSRALVALWRLVADGYNGGLLQFLGNWGVENHQLTLQALQAIGAPVTQQCLQDMFAVLGRFEDMPENVDFSDLPALLTDAEHEQLQELEEAFWDYPEPLNKLVVMHYGPAQ